MLIVLDWLQETIVALQEEQEAGLADMQGLVAGAKALPRHQVQPLFAALGQRQLDLRRHYLTLSLQPARLQAIISCMGMLPSCKHAQSSAGVDVHCSLQLQRAAGHYLLAHH